MPDEEQKDSVTLDTFLEVGDKKHPKARLQDYQMREVLLRVCKHDDIQKCLYEAVERHRKVVARDWVPMILNGVVTLLGIALTALITGMMAGLI